jgi:hypothetical protein
MQVNSGPRVLHIFSIFVIRRLMSYDIQTRLCLFPFVLNKVRYFHGNVYKERLVKAHYDLDI